MDLREDKEVMAPLLEQQKKTGVADVTSQMGQDLSLQLHCDTFIECSALTQVSFSICLSILEWGGGESM